MKIDFEVVSSTGPPHNRTFVTTVTVGEFSASGEGASKKASKHLASAKVLEELRKLPPLAKSHAASRLYQHGGYGKKTPKELDPSLNPISLLGQLRQRRKETLPVYTLVGEEGVRNKEFTMQVQVDSHIARGSGANKKEAKKNAAEAMLLLLGVRSAKSDSSSDKNQVNEGIDGSIISFVLHSELDIFVA
jgi:double-stranded RNA-binding protein Staufen